jgi:ATP-dependent Lhr-like helicase
MELSGEVLSGMFFHGMPGPQFISHRAFRLLQQELPNTAVFWINATDPASCAGLDLPELKGSLPKRLTGNYLVYRGSEIVLIAERNGEKLTFRAPPDDPEMQEYLSLFRHLLTREFQPKRRIRVKSINDLDAATSPYVDPFRTSFEVVRDAKAILLYRTYATP